MLSVNFSKTSKLLKFCRGIFFVMVFVKTDKDGQKNKPHFLTGTVLKLYITDVCVACISYSDQHQL